jgi:hypothetical protein
MSLTVFGITINLDGYAVDCFRQNHWMVIALTVFNITIQTYATA